MTTRREVLSATAATALLGALPRPAGAQTWPTRPIRMIVAFAPGGFTDIAARIVSERLATILGQPVAVDNRAGAAGIIGTEAAARSAADGYTLLMGTISTHAMNVGLYRSLSYDPVADFAPVSGVASSPNLLVAHPSKGIRDVAALIARAKAQPGVLTYGSGGNGTSSHLAGELFKSLAGVDLLHVPFRSTAPAATALVSGQVDLMFDTLPSALPHVRDGRLTALGVTSSQRLPSLPEIPAVAETVPGFEMGVWTALFAPAGTPRAVIERVDAATREALPQLAPRFAELGLEPFSAGPDEVAAHLRAEIAKWTGVIRQARITAD
ncbi:tripartite tricarboxylate transporter substrate binding protein [Roseomonas sp. SSH11]|uniref:Tripartite tricarboxylate transporter substrate binding protein n=1 Tax=Pararoseomonas baculiformis TaxID=2820812 RepID=A0ABS4AL13_9PROT|nr:tripartite tricarboxylate transporter substrate binding protein [Pararoseomonas baculiformis]MBP0447566.1 tripartite tricarboxylate transporter substrate binding protein [Pararoseomonas baculiformis]